METYLRSHADYTSQTEAAVNSIVAKYPLSTLAAIEPVYKLCRAQRERTYCTHLRDSPFLFDDPPLVSIGGHAHVHRPTNFKPDVNRRKSLDRVAVESVLVAKGRGGKVSQPGRQESPKPRAVNADGGTAD